MEDSSVCDDEIQKSSDFMPESDEEDNGEEKADCFVPEFESVHQTTNESQKDINLWDNCNENERETLKQPVQEGNSPYNISRSRSDGIWYFEPIYFVKPSSVDAILPVMICREKQMTVMLLRFHLDESLVVEISFYLLFSEGLYLPIQIATMRINLQEYFIQSGMAETNGLELQYDENSKAMFKQKQDLSHQAEYKFTCATENANLPNLRPTIQSIGKRKALSKDDENLKGLCSKLSLSDVPMVPPKLHIESQIQWSMGKDVPTKLYSTSLKSLTLFNNHLLPMSNRQLSVVVCMVLSPCSSSNHSPQDSQTSDSHEEEKVEKPPELTDFSNIPFGNNFQGNLEDADKYRSIVLDEHTHDFAFCPRYEISSDSSFAHPNVEEECEEKVEAFPRLKRQLTLFHQLESNGGHASTDRNNEDSHIPASATASLEFPKILVENKTEMEERKTNINVIEKCSVEVFSLDTEKSSDSEEVFINEKSVGEQITENTGAKETNSSRCGRIFPCAEDLCLDGMHTDNMKLKKILNPSEHETTVEKVPNKILFDLNRAIRIPFLKSPIANKRLVTSKNFLRSLNQSNTSMSQQTSYSSERHRKFSRSRNTCHTAKKSMKMKNARQYSKRSKCKHPQSEEKPSDVNDFIKLSWKRQWVGHENNSELHQAIEISQKNDLALSNNSVENCDEQDGECVPQDIKRCSAPFELGQRDSAYGTQSKRTSDGMNGYFKSSNTTFEFPLTEQKTSNVLGIFEDENDIECSQVAFESWQRDSAYGTQSKRLSDGMNEYLESHFISQINNHGLTLMKQTCNASKTAVRCTEEPDIQSTPFSPQKRPVEHFQSRVERDNATNVLQIDPLFAKKLATSGFPLEALSLKFNSEHHKTQKGSKQSEKKDPSKRFVIELEMKAKLTTLDDEFKDLHYSSSGGTSERTHTGNRPTTHIITVDPDCYEKLAEARSTLDLQGLLQPPYTRSVITADSSYLMEFLTCLKNDNLENHCGLVFKNENIQQVVKRNAKFKVDQEYKILRKLGAGGHGTAYLCTCLCNNRNIGKPFVVKKIQRNRFHEEEITIPFYHGEEHSRMLDVYGIVLEGDEVSVLMQYAEGGTLKECRTSPERNIQHVIAALYRVLQNVLEVHRLGIAHFDIKEDNIVFTLRGEPTSARLIDWGSSKVIHQTNQKYSNGTKRFYPPEMLQDWNECELDLEKHDVWTVACAFLSNINGSFVFDDLWKRCEDRQPMYKQGLLSTHVVYEELLKGKLPPGDLLLQLTDLFMWMLDPDVTTRASVSDALSHPVFHCCIYEATAMNGLCEESSEYKNAVFFKIKG
ncbi:uncharacterized protein LOC134232799 isoform X2 [Saccostrea cucullata]|uniref:uncharacterized protein LOC134232799 isoform X2 n=1 Tax=Saccostrea cuccullata TaxID=36930 RepID=UPI002ED0121C